MYNDCSVYIRYLSAIFCKSIIVFTITTLLEKATNYKFLYISIYSPFHPFPIFNRQRTPMPMVLTATPFFTSFKLRNKLCNEIWPRDKRHGITEIIQVGFQVFTCPNNSVLIKSKAEFWVERPRLLDTFLHYFNHFYYNTISSRMFRILEVIFKLLK